MTDQSDFRGALVFLSVARTVLEREGRGCYAGYATYHTLFNDRHRNKGACKSDEMKTT